MRRGILALGLLASLCACVRDAARAAPPFSGTIFIDPDIITAADPTTFQTTVYAGQGIRLMFDRRTNAFSNVNAYLFNTTFSDGIFTEIEVNPEFGSPALAQVEAQKYGTVIGRLPAALRADVDTVWIHKGVQPFGGGNHNLLIHTGQADSYIADGILEETFVHEASHTSLDASIAAAAGWLAAQTADNEFISTYARDNPTREDVAESFLPYLAARYRSDRISASLQSTILQTIPHRNAYFDVQPLNLFPLVYVGDTNNDRVVNFDDLNTLLTNYGQAGTFYMGDFNHSGMVDFADLNMLLTNYGTHSPVAATARPIPEPTTLALATLGTLGLLLAARRMRKCCA